MDPFEFCTTKSVSFYEKVRIRKSIHVLDYTDKERNTCWYSDSEYSEMRRDVMATLALLNNHDSKADEFDKRCGRGLEHVSGKGHEEKSRRRNRARFAVLTEQDRQFDNNEYDPIRIAEVYKKRTRVSTRIALVIGLCDQRVVDGTKKAVTHDFCSNLIVGKATHCQFKVVSSSAA
jgi:hypothetical protein